MSDLRDQLDIEAIIYDKRPDLVQSYLDTLEAARLVANAERLWICEYPEFGDPGCLHHHDVDKTWQPRKHSECRWVLGVDPAALTPGDTKLDGIAHTTGYPPGDTPITNCGDVKQIRHVTPGDEQ